MKDKTNKSTENTKEPTKNEVNSEFNLEDMTTLEIIARCGALRYSLTQIVALLRPRTSRDDINALILALRTSGSPEFEAYESGMTLADFQLQSQLLSQAATDKDFYDAFNDAQRRDAVNAALADKFGIGEDK